MIQTNDLYAMSATIELGRLLLQNARNGFVQVVKESWKKRTASKGGQPEEVMR